LRHPARARRGEDQSMPNASLVLVWSLLAGLVGLAVGPSSARLVESWPDGAAACAVPGCLAAVPAPVVGWALGGRICAACRPRRRTRAAIEAASAGLAGSGMLVAGPGWGGAAASLLGIVLVPVVAIDLRRRLIPDVVVLPATGGSLALAVAEDPGRWWVPVVAALGACAALAALWALHPAGMGLGDAKLALLLGAVLGAGVVPALALAFGAGGLAAAALLARFGRAARRMAMPFAPFLGGAALLVLWVGPDLAAGWLGL
jgi:leader peptidase (prepilin peptidase) / N-methyltransferase